MVGPRLRIRGHTIASIKALPKRKGNQAHVQPAVCVAAASMKAPPTRKGNTALKVATATSAMPQ